MLACLTGLLLTHCGSDTPAQCANAAYLLPATIVLLYGTAGSGCSTHLQLVEGAVHLQHRHLLTVVGVRAVVEPVEDQSSCQRQTLTATSDTHSDISDINLHMSTVNLTMLLLHQHHLLPMKTNDVAQRT